MSLPRWGWWSTHRDPVTAAAGDLCLIYYTDSALLPFPNNVLCAITQWTLTDSICSTSVWHQECHWLWFKHKYTHMYLLISSFAFSISLWAYFNTGQTPGENRLGSLNSANSWSSTEKQVWSWKDSTELYRKAPSFSFTNKTICSNTDTKAGAVTEACRTIAWTAHKPTHKQDEAQLQHCVVTAENCC